MRLLLRLDLTPSTFLRTTPLRRRLSSLGEMDLSVHPSFIHSQPHSHSHRLAHSVQIFLSSGPCTWHAGMLRQALLPKPAPLGHQAPEPTCHPFPPPPRRGAHPLPPAISSHQSSPEFYFRVRLPPGHPHAQQFLPPLNPHSVGRPGSLVAPKMERKTHLEATAMCVLLDREWVSKRRREREPPLRWGWLGTRHLPAWSLTRGWFIK